MVLQLKVFFPEVTIAKPKSSRNSSIGKSDYPSSLLPLCVLCNTSNSTSIILIALPSISMASGMVVMLLQRLLLSASITQSQRAFVQKTYSA